MLRVLFSLLIILCSALPVMADPALSPEQVEELPFNRDRAGTPNTDAIMGEIDMHDEVDHAEGGGLPQFNTDTFASQLFWLTISFGLLYFFFAKSSLPKLSATIEDRLTTIKTDIEQADTLSAEAEETKTSYEQAMTGAHEDARAYVAGAVAELRKDAEKDSEAFKEKSAKEVQKLEAQAEAAKEKIKSELAETAQNLTQEIVAKLSPLSVKDGDIQKAVADHMASTAPKTQKKAA